MDGKRTIRYESISDILISMFLGINKCLQGRNIFMVDFGSSRYQIFVISLICISAEFPTYNICGFLGTVGVIRKWIKNFTKIALPLTMLMRHSSAEIFNWNTEANEAFEQLKFLASIVLPLIKIDFGLALKSLVPKCICPIWV